MTININPDVNLGGRKLDLIGKVAEKSLYLYLSSVVLVKNTYIASQHTISILKQLIFCLSDITAWLKYRPSDWDQVCIKLTEPVTRVFR